MAHKSKDVLNSLAKTAADSFLKKKTSLNETLKKTASSEGLEPHQIEYVAAEANKMVWASHYQNDKKAAYDFPIADSKAILADLQTKPVEKVAEASLDYMLAPTDMRKVAQDGEAYGEFSTEITKDVDRRTLKHQLQARYEKLAAAREVAQGEFILIQDKIAHLEKTFVKEAREMIMHTPFTERAEAMKKIAEFVRGSGTEIKKGRHLMDKLATQVAKDGLIKKADMEAPEGYISETLPARIVNGNHSLFITLETIAKHEKSLINHQNNFIICDDTLPVLREKIRGL